MMVPSSLPNFEIPTGLMSTGLRGLRGFGRGLGQVSVGPLAQAQFSGQLNPSFLPTQYFTAGYSTTPQALPTWLYATQSFAQQIASLLGGSVVLAPPPGNYQGTNIPNAYWVQLPDGSMVLPGNLIQPGVVLSFPNECAAEAAFQAEIPGSELSATCAAGGTGLTPTQQALQNSNLTAQQQQVACNEIDGCTSPVNTATPTSNTTTPAVVTTTSPVTSPASVANPVTASTPGWGSTCATAQAQIAALQAAGQSNIVIWNQAPSLLLTCPSVQALNPTASFYEDQPSAFLGTSQPGTVSQGTQQQTTEQQATASSGPSTGTLIAIGLAVLVGIVVLSER